MKRCRICDGRLRYVASRFAWTHVKRGVDHAPVMA